LAAGAAIFILTARSSAGVSGSVSLALPASLAHRAQAAPAARQLGTIKAIKGNVITLSTDEGADLEVVVTDSARIIRVEPGQKDLKGATTLPFKNLQIGDRILVRGQPSADAKSFGASLIIAMKHEEVEAKQQREREDWQKHGIGGLVSAVDPAAGTVTLTVGSGPLGTTVTVIHSTKDTGVRRYSPDSVKFDDAKPSTLAAIHTGDQLRARGTRSADGKDFDAQEIVSGAFRNIAGTISSLDAAANSITIQDAITKQPVVVKLSPESQVRKLSLEVAQRIAARFKAAAAGANASAPPAGQPQSPPPSGASNPPAGGPRPGGAADFQQMLSRMPPATIAELQKGDAVMIVSTEGNASGQVTAITLLAGVEPILTASPRSAQAMMLSPWALGGGDSGAGGDASP
jgi:transcription antitermination factor NusG